MYIFTAFPLLTRIVNVSHVPHIPWVGIALIRKKIISIFLYIPLSAFTLFVFPSLSISSFFCFRSIVSSIMFWPLFIIPFKQLLLLLSTLHDMLVSIIKKNQFIVSSFIGFPLFYFFSLLFNLVFAIFSYSS